MKLITVLFVFISMPAFAKLDCSANKVGAPAQELENNGIYSSVEIDGHEFRVAEMPNDSNDTMLSYSVSNYNELNIIGRTQLPAPNFPFFLQVNNPLTGKSFELSCN